MREKFELYSKALGLILVCYGILVSLSMIPVYFDQPTAEMFFPESIINIPHVQEAIEDFNKVFPHTMTWITVHMFLQGALPALLGWYLMRSGNIFVRYCYPENQQFGSSIDCTDVQLGLKKEATDPQQISLDDERFAPPGYKDK